MSLLMLVIKSTPLCFKEWKNNDWLLVIFNTYLAPGGAQKSDHCIFWDRYIISWRGMFFTNHTPYIPEPSWGPRCNPSYIDIMNEPASQNLSTQYAGGQTMNALFQMAWDNLRTRSTRHFITLHWQTPKFPLLGTTLNSHRHWGYDFVSFRIINCKHEILPIKIKLRILSQTAF